MRQYTEVEVIDLIAQRGTVLVEFSADWCGPCKQMAKVIAATRLPANVTVAQCDVDECKRLVKSFGLKKVPTLVLVKAGVEVARREGVVSSADVLALVQRHG